LPSLRREVPGGAKLKLGEIDEAIAENALTFEALEVKYPGLARRA